MGAPTKLMDAMWKFQDETKPSSVFLHAHVFILGISNSLQIMIKMVTIWFNLCLILSCITVVACC